MVNGHGDRVTRRQGEKEFALSPFLRVAVGYSFPVIAWFAGCGAVARALR